MKTIRITSRQAEIIKEAMARDTVVKKLSTELDSVYEPVQKYVRAGVDYKNGVMVKNKIDGQEISLAALRDYLSDKHGLDGKFVEQVIRDWVFGDIKDGMLSSNIPLKFNEG